MDRKYFLPIAEGVLRGFILTLILILIYAAIMTFTDISSGVSSVFYMITTLISIMYGTVYTVRKIKKKGWVIGLIISIMYMIILYLLYIISGKDSTLIYNQSTLIRLALAVAVGILSGMLGINI
jgi:putative membrane protein (TIGR04086 family)